MYWICPKCNNILICSNVPDDLDRIAICCGVDSLDPLRKMYNDDRAIYKTIIKKYEKMPGAHSATEMKSIEWVERY